MPEKRIDRNVYLLGAGASVDAGAPLIRNFLDSARELYDSPTASLDDEEREHFADVFEFRRQMAQAREKILIDLDDIEQLFGLVDMSYRLAKPKSTKELRIRDSTVYLIAKTLQILTERRRPYRSSFNVAVKNEYADQIFKGRSGRFGMTPDLGNTFRIDAYEFFAGMAAGIFDDPEKRAAREDTIITFNYDLVCEHALSKFGIDADYALDADSVEDWREQPNSTTEVLKLHGSANWGVCGNCKGNVVILPQKITDSPAELRALVCTKCLAKSKFLPLLVPPSWDKSGHADVLSSVWRRAIDRLRSATRIIIIGYSLPETDAFFKYLLTIALAENHQLYRLIVVDRQQPAGDAASGVQTKYEALLDPLFHDRRFSFWATGFLSFLARLDCRSLLGRCETLVPTNY